MDGQVPGKLRILNGSHASQHNARIKFWVPSVAVCSARGEIDPRICSLTKANGSAERLKQLSGTDY